MDAELEKLLEAGKLTTKSAGQLEKLKPGTFCLHKSWGFGRVREWNLLLNQIVIDFATKKSHPMQAQYAAENLTPLAAEHFLVRKATDAPTGKLSSTTPTQIDITSSVSTDTGIRPLRILIRSGGRTMTCDPNPAILATDSRFCAP